LPTPDFTDFVTVRDFLIATIALADVNRSGILANMTELSKARIVDRMLRLLQTIKLTHRKVLRK